MSEQTNASPSNGGQGKGKGWGRRHKRARTSLHAAGEPMVWLTGGALAICTLMVAGLLSLVAWKGLITFWPSPVVQVETLDGQQFMGEITRWDDYRPEEGVIANLDPAIAGAAEAQLEARDGWVERRLFRTGNFRITQTHFQWVDAYAVDEETIPEWAMVMERLEWGRFYGFPEAFLELTVVDSVEEAREVLADLQGSASRELAVVDRRWQDGSEQELLLPVSELDSAQGLVGIAEVVREPEAIWGSFKEHHKSVRALWQKRRDLEEYDIGEINHNQERARLAIREAELAVQRAKDAGNDSRLASAEDSLKKAQANFEQVEAWTTEEFQRINREIDRINEDNGRFQLLMRTAGEGTIAPASTLQRLDSIVRAYPANQVGFGEKVGIYLSRWHEFLVDAPREANSEGGVFPAIFGTVTMTLIMSLAVVPFGVLAALYLREYAKPGPVTSAVRIAVNNLAGVPSIVFGVFGLGFFCYTVGASIDELFFAANLPNPTYGRGGILWASLTLALLTLPVVIVATEEAVAAVPNSMREGSYACGASKWQTIQRIVLPRALPGIITGMILAIARGAGEVAPLMLVGAVKLAPELPVDNLFPYLHPERSFMHLGFHIFDVGFQSQNSEAAKPMVYTTTLLLISIIAVLNLTTIWLRNRLRRKFSGGHI